MENSNDILEFDYMHYDTPVAHVVINFTTNEVQQELFTECPFDKALREVSMRGADEFFRRRCFPENRINRVELLNALGLLYYSPLEICLKTHGIMNGDNYWIRFKGESIKYDSISSFNPKNRLTLEELENMY